MRVRLKGINSKRKRLADGGFKTYYWAWKGGPALRGEPGTPEFIASYNEAVARKVTPPRGSLLTLFAAISGIRGFHRAGRPHDGAAIFTLIKRIEKAFGDFPLSALTDCRTAVSSWRGATRSPPASGRRQADYAWTVLARVLSWGFNRGLVAVNPCERGGRLYRGSRAEKIWTDADEAAFLERAPAHLHLPLLLALWTGQRQGDLLRLAVVGLRRQAYPLAAIEDRYGASSFEVGAPLKAAARCRAERSTIILTI